MTTFSVVIPAYNAEQVIERTLDSVRSQSYKHCEVLVTNDGSTDGTEQVISSYMGRYPQFPLSSASQQNRGIGAARNNGIFRAGGEYIAFLDADDLWYKTKLEVVSQYLYRHPDVDVLCHSEEEVDAHGRKRLLSYGSPREPAYEDLLFKRNRLSPSATVVRRSVATEVGGFSEDWAFNSAEDYDFWLRLARAGAKFAYLQEVLGEYHVHGQGVTANRWLNIRNTLHVLLAHFQQWQPQTFRYRCFMIRRMTRLIIGAFYHSPGWEGLKEARSLFREIRAFRHLYRGTAQAPGP